MQTKMIPLCTCICAKSTGLAAVKDGTLLTDSEQKGSVLKRSLQLISGEGAAQNILMFYPFLKCSTRSTLCC